MSKHDERVHYLSERQPPNIEPPEEFSEAYRSADSLRNLFLVGGGCFAIFVAAIVWLLP